MSCPHVEDGVVAQVCGECEELFCALCFATHSHPKVAPVSAFNQLTAAERGDDEFDPSEWDDDDPPVSAFGELTAAQRGDDEVEWTEAERADLQAYYEQLEREAAESVPVSDWFMAEATRQAEQRVETVVPPPLPLFELSLPQGRPVQTVALNSVTTLAKPAPSPREYPFRCLLWNVANLGGKFGYPKERDDSVIEATARIIHQADADVVSILELLGSGSGEKEPKPPSKPGPRGARGASNPLLEKLLRAFKLGNEGPAVEELKTLLGRYFSEQVQGAIWPGAAPDVTALVGQAKAFQDRDSGATLDGLLDRAWRSVCQPLLAGLAPRRVDADGGAPDPAEVDRLAAAIGESTKKRRQEKRKGGNQDHVMLTEQAEVLGNGILLLSAEGYTHWLESYASNYAKDDGLGGVSKEAGKSRDKACKKILEMLGTGCASLWVLFLRGLVGTEVTGEMRASWSRAEGPRASYENTLWSACWTVLLHANVKAMTADYERRLARWKKRHGKGDGKATKHDGVREFLRIRDALNVLASDAYDSWPAKLPEDADKSLYTQGETYGLLWKKATVAPDLDNVGFVTAFAGEFEFSKRQPLRFPLRLKKAASGSPIVLVPWHAPAPSASNATARSKDFPAFVRYCEAERKAKRLGVLLSDLNVNTVSGSTSVEHCDGTLEVGALFQGISGKVDAYTVFPAQVGTQSTLAVSKFRPWLIPDLFEQDDTSAELVKKLVNKVQSSFVSGHFKTSHGLLEFIQGHNKDFTPQHRMSASAYDKVLPICGRADRWKLGFKSTWAIPFPHALALEEEAEFFRPREQLSAPLKPFAFLLAKEAGQTLKNLRAYAEKPAKAKKLEELMLVARELSDHLPIVAELLLIDNEAAAEEAVVEAPIELFSVKPVASSELEERATAYESAATLPAREKALEELTGWWSKTYDATAPTDAAQRRFQRALQKWDTIVEAREKRADDDSRQSSRPALKPEEPRKKEDKKTLAVHLHSVALGARDNAGGGDCLFRSLAQLVFGDENRHDEVRQACVNHLEDLLAGRSLDAAGRVGDITQGEFATRLGQLHDWHRVQWPNALAYRRLPGVDRWQQFCLGMSRGGEWGDLIILCAASHLFGVRFRVYVQLGGGAYYNDEVDFVNRALGARPELTLVNYGNYHFVAAVPTAREALIDARVGVPEGWEGLRARRDRAPPPLPPQQPAPETGKPATSSPPTTSAPRPSGRVFRWPANVPWSLADANGAPGCLFLFGENGVNKGSRMFQPSTQACIRPAANAVGIRTCWKPGADESDQGAMLDGELAKNKKAMDEDFRESLHRLRTGRYTTLVIPWDTTKNMPALGTGVAKLPDRAKNTYAHLCECTAWLMKWAEDNLGRVLFCPLDTGLTEQSCKSDPESLFIHEVNCGLDNPDALRGWVGRSRLLQLPNVGPVRTGRTWFPPIQDAKLAENTRLLGLDFDALEMAVKSGRFRRVVYPEAGHALGQEADLQNTAPNTHAYVQKRLKQLADLCGATPAPLLASVPTSPPVSSSSSHSDLVIEDLDAGDDDPSTREADGRPTKSQRTAREGDVSSNLPKAEPDADAQPPVAVHLPPPQQPPLEQQPPPQQPPPQEEPPNPFKRRKTFVEEE
ncbi:OTU domain-containing protein [Pyxidicoccus sp. MSG2]|uniref:OTU domain-containing protein n=1 Tax=Pyxidicoccus sp. MSG2 TaxID=2996790 RepID=UPI0022711201|nr:hypothetical protein [Pyxidicoccus sp. MSG2]MCY1020143.1 hypothetical protein [Pyxidicoccus sp. MSG2]